MSFNPKKKYTIEPRDYSIEYFSKYPKKFIIQPPYQRKSVWSTPKKQSLMDSLFRRYYIPKLVIREVRLSDDQTVHEVIDGQQRITTVQEFFNNEYRLPKSLGDINPELANSYYKDLNDDIRIFIETELKYQVDTIIGIDGKTCIEHQNIATEIFRRLQQGQSLNYMEVAHAELSSLTRNFIVKYADDQTFDYENYKAVDSNPNRHKFFSLLSVDNKHMRHIQLMARFVLIEHGNGCTELGDKRIKDFIYSAKQKIGGIGNPNFEKEPEAKSAIKTLNIFCSIFKDDTMLDSESGIKELSVEYLIISIYVLIRHISKHYVMNDDVKAIIRGFVIDFHSRLVDKSKVTKDKDLVTFSTNSQQTKQVLEIRDMILRQMFFQYLKDNSTELTRKDGNRSFSEPERIEIYRRDNGLCQQCLRENKPEDEAAVSWSNYHADHVIPHSKGGQTTLENAELLCQPCNQSKGAS